MRAFAMGLAPPDPEVASEDTVLALPESSEFSLGLPALAAPLVECCGGYPGRVGTQCLGCGQEIQLRDANWVGGVADADVSEAMQRFIDGPGPEAGLSPTVVVGPSCVGGDTGGSVGAPGEVAAGDDAVDVLVAVGR